MSRNKKIKFVLFLGILGFANLVLFQNCSGITVTDLNPVLTKTNNEATGEYETIQIPSDSNPLGIPGSEGNGLIPSGPRTTTAGPITTSPPAGSTVVTQVEPRSQTDECDSDLDVIDWYNTKALSDAPQKFYDGLSTEIISVVRANLIRLVGNSAHFIDIRAAESAYEIIGNSANIRGNIRQVGQVRGNSGSLDLNTQSINDVYGSSGANICLRARNIGSIQGGSAGMISIINNFSDDRSGIGSVSLVKANSANKIRIFNMAVAMIEGGSGALHIQGGHISSIKGQSGDIFLDDVTVDSITGSSARIHLRNGAKVLNGLN